jgi:hypothetical protein
MEFVRNFICAEQMRMTDLYGDHPDLYPHLEKLARDLLPRARNATTKPD